MLTCGQPLHAFDLDKVRGGRIIVRKARRGGDHDHARRRRARVHRRDGAGLRRRGPLGRGRDHGRPDLRGLGHHHARADGGGHLGGHQHPAHLEGAEPALGGLDPVREAAAPRERAGRPAAGGAADGGAVRRADGAGPDRRVPRAAGAAGGGAAHGAGAQAAGQGHLRGRGGRPAGVAGLRRPARRWRPGRDRALLARRRRAARGRPDRGGGAHPRPGPAADHAARAQERRRPADPAPTAAAPAWRTRCATAACTRS